MIFLFFGSSLAHPKPEIGLFEVNGDDGETNNHSHQRQCHQLQTAVARVLDELERNPKKENHKNTLSKMMGTIVQAQLCTLSSWKAIYRPKKLLKIADGECCGQDQFCWR